MITSRRMAGFAVVAAVVLIPSLVAFFDFSPASRFKRAYQTLRLGMTRSATDAVFGKIPDYECRFREYQICYYRRPPLYGLGPRSLDRDHLPRSDTAGSISEIPYLYAAAQLMFDAEGRLVAFTQNGETTTIETTRGTVSGSSLAQLSEEYFP